MNDQTTGNTQAGPSAGATGQRTEPGQFVIEGRTAAVKREPTMTVYGVVAAEEAGARPYVITDERSKWWILFFRPYFRRITILQGPAVPSDSDARRLVEQTVARPASADAPPFTLLARLRDPADILLSWDEATGNFKCKLTIDR